MKLVIYLIAVVVTSGVSLYTFNFARWSWQKKNYRGAVGLFLLAGLTFAVPLGLLFLRS